MPSQNRSHDGHQPPASQPLPEPTAQHSEQPIQQTHPAAIIRRVNDAQSSLTRKDVLQLQRTVGNRTVERIFQRPVRQQRVQPKLRVGSAGDEYEREADDVARHVANLRETPEPAAGATLRGKGVSPVTHPPSKNEAGATGDETRREGIARQVSKGLPAGGSVIQRKDLNVPSLGGTITHVALWSLAYNTFSPTQWSELSAALAEAAQDENLTHHERISINKALEKVVEHRLVSGFMTLTSLAVGLDRYVVESKSYTAAELAAELHVPLEVVQATPPTFYPRISDLMQALEDAGNTLGIVITERVGFQPTLTGEKAANFPGKFERANDAEFFHVLGNFRRNRNTAPNVEFAGGEGQIYLSDADPNRCLKRWYASRIADLNESVSLLVRAREVVLSDEELSQHMEVVQVHDRGSDWIIRDFDPTSVKIKRAAGPRIDAAVNRLRQTGLLPDVLDKIVRKSDNIHWSPSLNKILVIDLM